jgi:hypothetical protein
MGFLELTFTATIQVEKKMQRLLYYTLLRTGSFKQGDEKVSVHLMITVQNTSKNILNSFNHLP